MSPVLFNRKKSSILFLLAEDTQGRVVYALNAAFALDEFRDNDYD